MGLIVAAFGASLAAKHLASPRVAAAGCAGLIFVWGLLQQGHPAPLFIACGVGFFPLWGSFVVVRNATFVLLVPAILLALGAGAAVDFIAGHLADVLDMHSRPVQQQIDDSERQLREGATSH